VKFKKAQLAFLRTRPLGISSRAGCTLPLEQQVSPRGGTSIQLRKCNNHLSSRRSATVAQAAARAVIGQDQFARTGSFPGNPVATWVPVANAHYNAGLPRDRTRSNDQIRKLALRRKGTSALSRVRLSKSFSANGHHPCRNPVILISPGGTF